MSGKEAYHFLFRNVKDALKYFNFNKWLTYFRKCIFLSHIVIHLLLPRLSHRNN